MKVFTIGIESFLISCNGTEEYLILEALNHYLEYTQSEDAPKHADDKSQTLLNMSKQINEHISEGNKDLFDKPESAFGKLEKGEKSEVERVSQITASARDANKEDEIPF